MDKFFSEFANDVYDVMAKNTDNITQEDFYDKYVANDPSFMIDEYKDKKVITFTDYTITIRKNR